MSIILDAIVIAVLILTVWVSYRRGFFRTLLSILHYFICFFVAGFLGKYLAGWLFDNLIASSVTAHLTTYINDAIAAGGVDAAIAQLSSAFPDALAGWALGGETIDQLAGGLLSQQNIEGAALTITDRIVRPAVVALLTIVLFFVLFLICRILFHFLYKLTGMLNRCPVIGLFNGLLGGVLGAALSLVYVMLFAMVAWLLIFLTGDSLTWLNTQIVHDTHLFYLFYNLNPFTW